MTILPVVFAFSDNSSADFVQYNIHAYSCVFFCPNSNMLQLIKHTFSKMFRNSQIQGLYICFSQIQGYFQTIVKIHGLFKVAIHFYELFTTRPEIQGLFKTVRTLREVNL